LEDEKALFSVEIHWRKIVDVNLGNLLIGLSWKS